MLEHFKVKNRDCQANTSGHRLYYNEQAAWLHRSHIHTDFLLDELSQHIASLFLLSLPSTAHLPDAFTNLCWLCCCLAFALADTISSTLYDASSFHILSPALQDPAHSTSPRKSPFHLSLLISGWTMDKKSHTTLRHFRCLWHYYLNITAGISHSVSQGLRGTAGLSIYIIQESRHLLYLCVLHTTWQVSV